MRKLFLALAMVLVLGGMANAAQTATMVLNWTNGAVAADNSNAPTAVKVERGSALAGPFTQIATLGVVQTYTDVIAADPGSTTYCYRVRESNSAGDSTYSNVACATSPAIVVPPNPPTGMTINLTVK